MRAGNYPGILERIKAILVDTIIIIVLMFIVSHIFSSIGKVPDNWKMIALIFIFILYDPLFTSIFGGTIGHMVLGIRVKKERDPTKNILFPMALIRYIFKTLLGWISLLTVSSNTKGKAIHDMIAGSVVVYKK